METKKNTLAKKVIATAIPLKANMPATIERSKNNIAHSIMFQSPKFFLDLLIVNSCPITAKKDTIFNKNSVLALILHLSLVSIK